MSVQSGPNGIESGLVLYLDAANRKSFANTGTTWTDMSGLGNNATLTNGPVYNSNNGGSVFFDGSNDYAPLNSTGFPLANSSGTICAWANATVATAGNGNWIVSYGNPGTSQARFIGFYNQIYYFGGYGDDITSTGVQTNTWFHMVGVYDGTNASMYINGRLVAGPTAKTWNTVANNAQLGRQINTGEYWNGNISQVSIYNRALSAAEIRQLFNATRGRFGI